MVFMNEDLNLPIMRFKKYVIVVFLLSQCIDVAISSEGDQSPFYQKCVRGCLSVNCTQDGQSFTTEAAELQDKWSQLLQWSCRDECRYHCMWDTVQAFVERGYNVPKFHGKWPFVRMYGVQEPASAFASLLNLLAHVYMLTKIVRQFPIRDTPLVPFWCLFGAVCIHAWIWSIIFHTRDNNFTEFMDYSCALSMVMALFVAAVVRMLHRRRLAVALALLSLALYYRRHVWYLAAGRVDYDYNMRVNVFFGALGSVLWVAWAARQLAAGRRYAWRVVCFAALSGAALALELLDFPPGRTAFDAHALWHLSTAPLPLLFYKFVIDDLHYLHSMSSLEKLK